MPVSIKQEGKKWRVIDPDGNVCKNSSGTACDGGGHSSRMEALAQMRAMNINMHKEGKFSEGTWDLNPKKKGMFKGQNLGDIDSQLEYLKKTGPHKEGSAEFTKMKELEFAKRAKHHWK